MIRVDPRLGAEQGAANESAVARLGQDLAQGDARRMAQRKQSFQEGAVAAQHNQRAQFHASSLAEAETHRAFQERQALLGFTMGEASRERQHGRNIDLTDRQADRADQRDANRHTQSIDMQKRQFTLDETSALNAHGRGMSKQADYFRQLNSQAEERHDQTLQLRRTDALRDLGRAMIDGYRDVKIHSGKLEAEAMKGDRDAKFKLIGLMLNQTGAQGRARVSVEGHKMLAGYHEEQLAKASSKVDMTTPEAWKSYIKYQTGQEYNGPDDLNALRQVAQDVAREKLRHHAAQMNYQLEAEDADVGAFAEILSAIGRGDPMFESMSMMMQDRLAAQSQVPAQAGQAADPGVGFGGDMYAPPPVFPGLGQLQTIQGGGGQVLRPWNQ